MQDLKSHFQQDFLALCTRLVSVHLVMASAGCSFNSFSIFLFSLKQQKLMKTVFLYPFFNMAVSPQNNKKNYFILVNYMGWQIWHCALPYQWAPLSLWKCYFVWMVVGGCLNVWHSSPYEREWKRVRLFNVLGCQADTLGTNVSDFSCPFYICPITTALNHLISLN